MNIYVFSDESGVLDKVHHDIYTFGGLVFLSKEDKDDASRLYYNAEKTIKDSIGPRDEIKANNVTPSQKGKLYRSLNRFEKFGAIINQKKLRDEIFQSKKTKQRYLDWVYKMAIKRKFEAMIHDKLVVAENVKNLIILVDEHTTATDGIYELREAIEHEFKYGTFTNNYMNHYPPIFSHLNSVQLEYRDSKTTTLVRAADIVANQLYHMAEDNNYERANGRHFSLFWHP